MQKIVLLVFLLCPLLVFAESKDAIIEQHYRGTLNNTNHIYMKLVQKGDSVAGSYVNEAGEPKRLMGVLRRRQLVLEEFSYDSVGVETKTGSFTVALEIKSLPETLTGIWLSADRKKTLPFIVSKSGFMLVLYQYSHKVHTPYTPEDSFARTVGLTFSIKGMPDLDMEKKANKLIHAEAFRVNSGGMMATAPGATDSVGWYDEHHYSIEFMTDRLISTTTFFSKMTDVQKPIEGIGGLTIDLTTGEKLSIRDVIKPASWKPLYMLYKHLMAKCMDKTDKDIEASRLNECVADFASSTNFMVTPIGLQMSFTSCLPKLRQSCGVPVLEWKQIRKMLLPEGPLREFAK